MRILRSLLAQRAYVALVTLTLALAVGANLVVFSLVKAIWLRPDPVPGADRLVMVLGDDSNSGLTDSFFFGPAGLDELRSSDAFDVVAGQVPTGAAMASLAPRIVLAVVGRPVEVIAVTPEYFSALHVDIRGRDFTSDDDREGAEPVAIISGSLWQRGFGGRADIIGQLAPATPVPVRIIGVAQEEFEGARLGEHAQIWIPRGLVPRVAPVGPMVRPENISLLALARLHVGFTPATAEKALAEYLASIKRPMMAPLRVVPIRQVFGSPQSRTIVIREETVLRVVVASSLLVLLAGCVTLMALVLVHYERRRGELSVRLALGASRGRLIGQLASELSWIMAIGAIGASLFASWSLRVLPALSLPGGIDLARLNLSVDWPVALAGFGLVMVSVAVAALIPALRFTRADLARSLVTTAGAATPGSHRLRRVLLAVHVAATIVLLVAAGLFVRTIAHGFTSGTGFDTARTLFADVQIQAPFARSREENDVQAVQRGAGVARLVQALRAVPGAEVVALGNSPIGPLPARQMLNPWTVTIGSESRELRFVRGQVGSDFLNALGVSIERGRDFTVADATGDPMPAIVTRSLATLLWPGQDPIGQTFKFGVARTVVGVIPDVAFGSFSLPHAFALLTPATLSPSWSTQLGLVIRTERPETQIEPVRRLIAGVFPDAPRVDIATGREIVARDLGRERLGAWFFSGFGLVALALGIGGVFGLVAYLAESRRREFGVRIALGATSADLIHHAVGVGLTPVVAGAMAGLIAAALLARFVSSLLVGVSQFDPLTYVAVALLMTLCATAAGLVAAWRVRRLSPMDALRAE